MRATYTIGQHYDEFIKKMLEDGRYNNASEIIRAGLGLLEDDTRLREVKLEEMRKAVRKGIDDLENGRYTSLENDEDVRSFFEEIKQKGREKLAAQRSE